MSKVIKNDTLDLQTQEQILLHIYYVSSTMLGVSLHCFIETSKWQSYCTGQNSRRSRGVREQSYKSTKSMWPSEGENTGVSKFISNPFAPCNKFTDTTSGAKWWDKTMPKLFSVLQGSHFGGERRVEAETQRQANVTEGFSVRKPRPEQQMSLRKINKCFGRENAGAGERMP